MASRVRCTTVGSSPGRDTCVMRCWVCAVMDRICTVSLSGRIATAYLKTRVDCISAILRISILRISEDAPSQLGGPCVLSCCILMARLGDGCRVVVGERVWVDTGGSWHSRG